MYPIRKIKQKLAHSFLLFYIGLRIETVDFSYLKEFFKCEYWPLHSVSKYTKWNVK